MSKLADLINALRQLGRRNLDPVFYAHEVRERVLDADLERSEWVDLMETFKGSPSATVSAGIAGALAKHADLESSPLEVSDLFPFLRLIQLEHKVSRNSALAAVQLWMLRTPVESLEESTLKNLIDFLRRSASQAKDSGSQETILEILADFLFDVEVGDEIFISDVLPIVSETLTTLTGLGPSSEQMRVELLENLRD